MSEAQFILIYHLTPASAYRRQPEDQPYQPETMAQEGFIHCTAGAAKLMEVANTFFADLQDDLLVLEIDPTRLMAPLVFEPPIPPVGVTFSGQQLFVPDSDTLFPHIYGPLNREAIVNCFELRRDLAGKWQMP